MSNLLIQPKYLTFADLVSKRLFQVPHYQRAYSWTTRQRKDLFEDIEKVAGKSDPNFTHFMATVVGLRKAGQRIRTDNYDRLDIVDGQQRLTTLIILLKAMEQALDERDSEQKVLRDEIAGLLVKDSSGTLLLLQTNHDRSTYFADYIRDGDVPDVTRAQFLADKDLAKAIVECGEFVQEWSSRKRSLLDLATIVKNRLTFIFHEINDEAAVYTVFEVLNSRGLEVAWLDRTKSLLMAVAFENAQKKVRNEIINELHLIWGKIYDCIGLRQGMRSETLRFAATLKTSAATSKVLGESDAADTFRLLCGDDAKTAVELSRWILTVSEAVDDVFSNTQMEAVTEIVHARLLAVAISLAKFKKSEKERLKSQWERVTFRIFGMCRRDARQKVGEYVRLACGLLNSGKPNVDDAMQDLVRLGAGEYSIVEACKRLEQSDCYEGWEDQLRYFLWRYENFLAEQNNQTFSNEQWSRIWEATASKSIEHIHPQNPTSGGPWKGALGRGRGQKEKHVHRLGNLLLIPPGLNSQLGNSGFDHKRKEYAKTGLLIAGQVASKRKWNAKAINEREKQLITWARIAWDDVP